MIAHGHFFGCPCTEFVDYHGVRYCVCCGLRAYPEKPPLPATIVPVADATTPPAVGPAEGVYEEPLGGPPMSDHHTQSTPAPVKVEQ